MAKRHKYKIDEVIAALKQTNGKVYLAADVLKCTAQTVYNYRDAHAEIRQVIEDEEEKVNDVAESALYRAILNGEAWAVCFRLKTRAKHRGYIERSEQEVNVNVREVALPIKAQRDEWIELYAGEPDRIS